MFIFRCHFKESRQVIQLLFNISVEDTLVAFPASPEHKVFSSQLKGDVHGFFYLGGGVGEDVSFWVRGGPVHVARMREEIGGSPEKFNASLFLEVAGKFDDSV